MLQGIWKPRKIDNPDFFEDKEPFKMTSIVSILKKGKFLIGRIKLEPLM